MVNPGYKRTQREQLMEIDKNEIAKYLGDKTAGDDPEVLMLIAEFTRIKTQLNDALTLQAAGYRADYEAEIRNIEELRQRLHSKGLEIPRAIDQRVAKKKEDRHRKILIVTSLVSVFATVVSVMTAIVLGIITNKGQKATNTVEQKLALIQTELEALQNNLNKKRVPPKKGHP